MKPASFAKSDGPLRWMMAWRSLPFWLLLAAVSGGMYLLVAAVGYDVIGFPLDDAWIHQTYARNLATTGRWAFTPGQTSAGSTAPLWSLLLSLGYLLGLPFRAWSYGLGIVLLGLSGWTLSRLGADLFSSRAWIGPLVGLFCVFEWHLAWAAVSGMETILFIWLSLLLVDLWNKTAENQAIPLIRWGVVGFAGGLLVLTRPEGVGLIGLIGLAVAWQQRYPGGHRRSLPGVLRAWLPMGIGLILPLAPYLVFHYTTTGLPFPNTFYAKQQEYRALLDLLPWWRRWLTMVGVTLVGAQLLLLPGFIYQVWRSISSLRSSHASYRSGAIGSLLLLAWWFAHLTIYALRLPVTYQHGRYQMPTIPFFVLLGLAGTIHLLRPRARALLPRVLSRATIASTVLVCVAFLGLGAQAYATDVAFIEGEMVATARWLDKHTRPDELIAVHDIGAVGYFANRPLLDLAGLVTPDVIPFITDEVRLVEFMQAQGTDYVVFFPDWSNAYRRMARDSRLEEVFATGFEWTREQGHANMTVYRLRSSK